MAFSFPALIQAAITRLSGLYNSGRYDASTNPGGMANNGHRTNFVPALQDVAAVAGAVGSAVDAAAGAASTASDKADAAGRSASAANTSAGNASTSETNAGTSAGLAQKWATLLGSEVVAGQGFSARYWAQKAADLVNQATGGAILPAGSSFGVDRLLAFAAADGRTARDSGFAISDLLKKAGDTLAGALNLAPPVTIASAATVELGTAGSNVVLITGTVNITRLGSIAAGATRRVRFASAGLVLTHNATALILPGTANITTQANDTAEFLSLGSGNWLCLFYQRADGRALIATAAGLTSVVTGRRTLSQQNENLISASEKGYIYDLIGTVGLMAYTNVGAGFYCYLRKRDNLDPCTLTTNSGLIDGLTSLKIYQEDLLLWFNGTDWFTVGRQRGWISIQSVKLSGQSINSLEIRNGFNDPEISEIELKITGLRMTGSASLQALIFKDSLVTGSTYSYVYDGFLSGSGQLGEGTSSISQLPIANRTFTGAVSAVINVRDTISADGFDTYISWTALTSQYYWTGSARESTNQSVKGLFLSGGGNFTDFSYSIKGFRK